MHSETYTVFMMDRCTGALEPGLRVAADLHVALSSHGRDAADFWDVVGGALLEQSDLDNSFPARSRRRPRDFEALAVADIRSRDLSLLRWRKSLGGAEVARSGIERAHYMRLMPDASVPRHGHSAVEATVVLQGELQDGDTIYQRGDIALGVPGEAHRPAAHGNMPCICFVARGKRPFWRLT